MIVRVLVVAVALAMSVASQGQTIPGAWHDCSLKWIDAPPEFEQALRSAPATVLYFGTNHAFMMVKGTIWEQSNIESLGADIVEIHFGKWSQYGATLNLEYRLIDRVVAEPGEKIPGSIQTKNILIKRREILFGKKCFLRDSRLDNDLQKLAKAVQVGHSREKWGQSTNSPQ